MPTTVACLPVFFRLDILNSLPMAKAMKPSATWDTSFSASTACMLTKPRPAMPARPRQYGPISTPVTRYAVTDGSPSGLATRVIIRPTITAMATDNNSVIIVQLLSSHFSDRILYVPSVTVS